MSHVYVRSISSASSVLRSFFIVAPIDSDCCSSGFATSSSVNIKVTLLYSSAFSGEVDNMITPITHHLHTSASDHRVSESIMHLLPLCDNIQKESHHSKLGFLLSESRAVTEFQKTKDDEQEQCNGYWIQLTKGAVGFVETVHGLPLQEGKSSVHQIVEVNKTKKGKFAVELIRFLLSSQ
ncbi:unnamed protein product [Lactuca saligna]|uniref:Uncharacterized protein n=1 Tax=Lactuca saligna TaxID=75948 RepID=A0AA36E1G9_LACSI|nr:unnamed protein product [Lactuca saligna]